MLHWVTDVSRGGWVAPRLGPFGPVVGSVVPRGYEAYARVLHRARSGRGTGSVRWADVAAASGTVLHPTAQWWALARRPGYDAVSPFVGHDEPWPSPYVAEGDPGARRAEPGEWAGGEPDQGRLDTPQLTALVRVLRGFTEPDAVTAGFWEGSGWQGGTPMVLWTAGRRLLRWRVPPRWRRHPRRVGRDLGPDPDVDPRALDGPKLELPNRRHLLFAGSLGDVAALAAGTATADVSPFRTGDRTPSLLWPDSRAWCVATEVDFDSTFVGGPRALIAEVLADPTLEAFEVAETDSLGAFDDEVNR